MWFSKKSASFSAQADEKNEELVELMYFIPDDVDQPEFLNPPGKGSLTIIKDDEIEITFEDNRGNSLTVVYEWTDNTWVMKDSYFNDGEVDLDEDFDGVDDEYEEY